MKLWKMTVVWTAGFLLFFSFSGRPVFGADSTAPDRRTWQSRGIGGGGALYAPTISPHDPRVIYMATDMSSVFRSLNFGRTWETLHFERLQGGVDSQVRFTSDPGVLYALHLPDDDRAPVKSTDGGRSWTALPGDPTGKEAFYLFADPADTERVLVSDWDSLYFSSDGGASFASVYSVVSPGDGLHVGGVFWDGATIIVGTSDGVVVSEDNGTSFSLAPATGMPAGAAMVTLAGARENSVVRLFAVAADAADVYPGRLAYGVSDLLYGYRGVYRMDWPVAAWSSASTGIAADARPVFVAMADNDVDVVYAAGGSTYTGYPIVYKTTGGGGNWQDVFATADNGNIATGWSGRGGDTDWWFGEYALGFTVCPNDPDRVALTDLGFVHVSDNGGQTWRQAYVNPSDQNPAGALTPKARTYRGVGLQQTSSWWLMWADAQTLVAAFTDIRGMRSQDGGMSWQAGSSLGLPHNSTYRVLRHPSTGKLYACTSTVHDLYQSTYLEDSRIDGGDGHVLVSSDDGLSWDLLHDFNHPVVWLAPGPDATDRLYAGVVHSTEGDIYVTDNLSAGNSASWTRLASPPRTQGHPFTLRVLEDGSLVASYSGRRHAGAFTESSGVFVSADGGANWLDRSHGGMRRWTKDVVIDPHDPDQNTWYASVFSHWGSAPNEVGGLYRTTDQGGNWTRISDLYRVESCTIDPSNPNRMYVSTETQGLWATENLQEAWPEFTPVPHYPFAHPVRIFFNPYDTGEIWVTSFGGGLRVSTPISLNHAVQGLRVLAGLADTGIDWDENGNHGMKDVLFVLQHLVGARP